MNRFYQRISILLLLVCLSGVGICCSGDDEETVAVFTYVEAFSFGGVSDDLCFESCTDGSGGLWVVGSFKGTTQVGNSTFTSNGEEDIVIALIESDSDIAEVAVLGGTGTDIAFDIAEDGLGGCWITGIFSGSMVIGGSTYTADGASDIFVAHLDDSMNWSGVCVMGSDSSDISDEISLGVCTDGSTGCWITGYFVDDFSIDGINVVNSTTKATREIFVAHIDEDGDATSVVTGGSDSNDIGTSVSYNGDGGCYVAGFFSDTATFGSVYFTSDNMQSSSSKDIFIGVVGSDGNWDELLSPTGNFEYLADVFSDINCLKLFPDPSNGFVLCGNYAGSLYFGNSHFTSSGDSNDYELFVAHMNSSLDWVFANVATNCAATNCAYADGMYWVCGTFTGTALFGNYYLVDSGTEMFVASLDPDGEWTDAARTSGRDGGTPTSIQYNGADGVWVAGEFAGNLNFNDDLLNSNGNSDIFLANTGEIEQ